MARDQNYKVGYKRPPAHSRFRPGESGNPAGRPKGRKNLQTAVREYLEGQVQVSIGQRKQMMTRLEAFVHRVFNSAISGDIKAFQHALTLARLYDAAESPEASRDPQLEAQKLALVRQLLNPRSGTDDEAAPSP
jgi:hypothetical protein